METFHNFKNRKGFYNKPNQFIKNRLIEGIDNNNKPIRINVKSKSDLVNHELNQNKEKTEENMNDYFKPNENRRENDILSHKKEYNNYSIQNNRYITNEINRNMFYEKPKINNLNNNINRSENISDINKDINNKDTINKEDKPISRSISIKSAQIYNNNEKIYYRNKRLNNLEMTNSFISENNNVNNLNITQESNKTVNTKFISPIASYVNSINGRITLGNSILARKFHIPTSEEQLMKFNRKRAYSNLEVKSEPTSYRLHNLSNNDFKYHHNIFPKKNLSNPNIIQSENISSINENYINSILKFEDLIYLEKKLKNILNGFDNLERLSKYCVEWYNFYVCSTFYCFFNNFTTNTLEDKRLLHEYSVLEFLTIIVIYELIKDINITQSTINCLIKLMDVAYQNFLIISDFLISMIIQSKNDNLWVKKLNQVISKNIENKISKNNHLISLKNGCISILIKNILKLYNTNIYINPSELVFFLRRSSRILIKTLSDYFNKKINLIVDSDNIEISEIPFISNNNDKIFTLILEIEGTMLTTKKAENGQIIIFPRPYLKQFLREISKTFEIIIFTSSEKCYNVDQILNSLDKKKRFFPKRLYKENTILFNNVYLKDLSKLGRDLSKVIILDNNPLNFQLQRENGIFVRNFYGNKNDTVFVNLLPILKTISNNINNDVREEIRKLSNEIYMKITTDLGEDKIE